VSKPSEFAGSLVTVTEKYFRAQVLNKFCTRRPQVFHILHEGARRDVARRYNGRITRHLVLMRTGLLALLWLLVPGVAAAASEPMLFRLFLQDGTSVVSYGEFARVGDHVVFSVLMGGSDQPRLHATTLPAHAVDWNRTDLHAASTRYQWYAQTRGEEDFGHLSDEVAAVLNTIVMTRDGARALEIAKQARATLAEWPREHYGYRQRDVREILAILDEAISAIHASTGGSAFEVSLVADAPDIALEALAPLPTVREQIDQAFRVAALVDQPAERVALLQAALRLLADEGAVIPPAEAATIRRTAEAAIRVEQAIDARYTDMARRLMTDASRGAARARVADVEQVLNRISREDARLGRRRPQIVQALHSSVQQQLDAARKFRLLRDQWMIRRSLYFAYQRSVGTQLLQLVKSQPALEAIRRLDGPAPDMLVTLQSQLRGGAERLQRIAPPPDLRATHELLLGAWRFAETAVDGRYEAARGADVNAAWGASSSAAGALLLLSRAQQEIRTLLEPPQLTFATSDW
jgi:hypothetical protein